MDLNKKKVSDSFDISYPVFIYPKKKSKINIIRYYPRYVSGSGVLILLRRYTQPPWVAVPKPPRGGAGSFFLFLKPEQLRVSDPFYPLRRPLVLFLP